MLLQQGAGGLHQLKGHELVALLLEPSHNVGDDATLHGVGLGHDVGAFHGHAQAAAWEGGEGGREGGEGGEEVNV